MSDTKAGQAEKRTLHRRLSPVPRRIGPEAAPGDERPLDPEISPVWEVMPRFGSPLDVPGTRAHRTRDAIFRRLLGLSDVLAGYGALAMAILLLPGDATRPARWAPAVILIAPFIVLASKAFGLYDHDQHRIHKTTVDEAPGLLQLAVLYALTVWISELVLVDGRLTRAQVFALVFADLGLTMLFRACARALALRMTAVERCLVVGHDSDANRVRLKLAGCGGINALIVGRVCVGPDNGCRPAALGQADDLPTLIREHRVERVIVAPDGHDEDEILDCIRLVKALGVKVSVLPRLLEVVGSSSVFDDLHGMTLLGVRQYGLSKSSELLKRIADTTGASLGLVVLAPLFVILAVAIRLDSRGPALFRQSRIGRRGEQFWMIKFRSMMQGADALKDDVRGLNHVEGGLFKIDGDPRITRVGGFLRRTSLDELPQLFNVLKGDMSLVGPRPLVQDEDVLIEGWERRRLAVKPGITGLWQIFGSSRIPKDEMVKIDYLYGANWSIWLDLKILIRTVPYVLGRRGR